MDKFSQEQKDKALLLQDLAQQIEDKAAEKKRLKDKQLEEERRIEEKLARERDEILKQNELEK